MAHFFETQLDYIYFFYGLGFFMLGATCFILWKTRREKISWIYLGLFGITHGVNEWLDLISISLGQNPVLDIARSLALIVSFAFLFEFGRSNLFHALGKKLGAWIYLPIFLVIAWAGFQYGQPGVSVYTRYVLGFAGGLFAAGVLFFAARNLKSSGSAWLIRVSLLFMAYALTQSVAQQTPFFPASIINSDIFFYAFGFPIPLVRGILAFSIAIMIWFYLCFSHDIENQYRYRFLKKYSVNFIILMTTIFILGWYFTQRLGESEEQEIKRSLLSQVLTVSSLVHMQNIPLLNGSLTDVDKPPYEDLRSQLKRIRDTDRDFRFVCLLGLKEEKILFLVDAEPPDSKDFSPPGQIYEEAPSSVFDVFKTGQPLTIGPFSDRWGTWVSAFVPIRDFSSDRVGAVLEIDTNARILKERLAVSRLSGIVLVAILSFLIISIFVILFLREETALRIIASEDRFRSIFENAPEAVFILDILTRNILEVNPFMTYWLKTDRAQLLSMSWGDLFDVEIPRSKVDISESMKDRSSFTQEYLLKKKESSLETYVEITGISLKFRGRDCVLVFMRDITGRKKMEGTLQESEEYFRSLIENALDIILIISPSGTVKYVSASLQNVLGYKVDEFMGKSAFDFIHTDDLPAVINVIAQNIQSRNATASVEFRFRHRDGSWRIVDARGRNHLYDPKINGIVVNARDITERKHTEEKIRVIQLQQEAILNNIPDMAWLKDKSSRYIAVNEPFGTMCGFVPSHVIGKTDLDIWPLDLAEKYRVDDQEVMRQGKQRIFEEPLADQTGKRKWIETIKTPIFNERGEIVGTTGIAHDITQRKEAEEILRDSEEKFRVFVENLPLGVAAIGEKGETIIWNQYAEKILGYNKEEALGVSLIPRLAESPERFADALEKVEKGGVFDAEVYLTRKDGQKILCHLVIIPKKDDRGNTVGYYGMGEDITVRKQAEEELRKLSRAVEQSPASVVITDTCGNIEYVNPKFTESTGYSISEVIGKNPRVLKSGETPLSEYKKLWDTITSGREWHGIFHNRKKNGELFWESVAISPIRNQEGKTTHYLGIKEDITVQRKMEEELRVINQDLLRREGELRKALNDLESSHAELKNTQSQLLQSEKLAAIGQLAAGIAHEINNPVGFISSNLESLDVYIDSYEALWRAVATLKEAVKAKDLEKADLILTHLAELETKANFSFITSDIDNLLRESKSGVERIKKIVADLRTFARTDRDTMDLANIEEIIDSVINIVWNEIKYKAELKKEYGKLPPFQCNPQRLGQVFINMLINAAQAIKDKGLIEIRTFVDGDHACIEIKDSGCGIPKQNLTKIFDPFFTTKPVGKGTGLGLSISYDIIKQHGGRIEVQSEPNQGTVFTIRLPLFNSSET